MDRLTTEYVVENKMTYLDCMRHFKPDITEELADLILWEETCFPHDIETVIEQINNFFLKEE